MTRCNAASDSTVTRVVSRPTRLPHAPNTFRNFRNLDTCSAELASNRVRTRVLGRVDTMKN
jgi:hypothetical protein